MSGSAGAPPSEPTNSGEDSEPTDPAEGSEPTVTDDASGEESPAPDPEPKSRAGRNLPAAFVVGVLLAATALASLYFVRWLFIVLAVVAIFLGTAELSGAMRARGIVLARFPLLLAAVALPALAYWGGSDQLLMGFGLVFLFMLGWRLFRRGTDNFVRDATASSFVLSYAPLMGGFAALIAAAPDGADLVVTFLVLSVASDIGGYATGVLFGKHPMAKNISPKKSWEGFAGSVGLQVILGVALFATILESDWWKGAIVGAVMAATATLGDFIESAIKRDLGLKDMSSLLPGHGGVMDRLDSIIPNTVVAYALFTLTLGGLS